MSRFTLTKVSTAQPTPSPGQVTVYFKTDNLLYARDESGTEYLLSSGMTGPTGADGKTIRNGSGVPSSGLGVDGDFYVDTAALNLYGPKTAGAWGSPTSIVGPTGATGAAGAAGAVWRDGTGVPSSGLGINGDYYLDDATSDVYFKSAGSYSIVTNIKGATGATGTTGATGAAGAVWRTGSGAPSSGLGINGDYYLNSATSDVYLKTSGSYSIVANIKGATGSTGSTGAAATIAVGTVTTGAPGSSAVVNNSGTSSAAVFDITIPRGDVGATGPTGPTGVIAATAPLAYDTPTETVSIPKATGSQDGYLDHLDFATFNAKEPAITASVIANYWRGDKTFQPLNTAAVPESGSLYFTQARARASLGATAPLSYDSSTGIVSLIAPDVTASQIRFVNRAGNDTTGDGTYLKPFLTIQKANDSITDATNAKRSVIVAAPGFYSETVTLKDNVSLFGYGFDLTQILAVNYTAAAGATGRTNITGISIFGALTTDTSLAASTGINVTVNGSNLGSWAFNGGTTVTNNNILGGASRIGNVTNNGGIFLMNGASIFGNLLLAGAGANTYAEIWGGFIQGNVTATGLSQLYIDNTTIYGSAIGVASGANKPTFYYDVGSYPEAGLTPSQWATIVPASDATMLGYTPTTPGNWLTQPTTPQQALDTLAARMVPVTKTLYVDGNRTDSYTANGTILYPFKTIQAAINQVIANADNATYIYNIVISSTAYAESLTFNSTSLRRLTLTGVADYHGNSPSVTSAGNVIDSSSNNDNLVSISFQNMSFSGNVNLVGSATGTLFASEQATFVRCNLSATNVTFNNMGFVSLYDSLVALLGGTFLVKNVGFGIISGGDGVTTTGTLQVVTDGAANKPSGFSNTNLIVERTLIALGTITVDASSYLQTRIGSRIGSGAGTISISGTLEGYNSFLRGAVTINSGGTLLDHGCMRNGTLTVNGTYTPDGKTGYAPATPGNWPVAPKDVWTALDTLVARKIPTGKTLYVDGGRTDSYTADGTRQYPFKTIMAAINQIIANADNATYKYVIEVAVATYAENITLNDLNLRRITITGPASSTATTAIIQPASGNAIDSSSNNGNIAAVSFNNIVIAGNVNLVGATAGTNFASENITFRSCSITPTTALTVNNAGTVYFYDGNITGNGATILVKNCNFVMVSGGDGIVSVGTLTLTHDGASNTPAGYSGQNNFLCERTLITLGTISVSAGSYFQPRIGSRIGSSGGSLSLSGTMDAYNSFFRSGITVNSGGTFIDHGSIRNGALTINSGGTYSPDGKISAASIQANAGALAATAKMQVNPYVTTDAVAQAMFNTGGTTNKGVVVQGVVSQAANLQEWQDSSGSALALVASDGSITSGAATSGIQIGVNSATLGILQAVGSATNIPLVIAPKGSGSFMTQVPDSTIAGGNARGLYATDMQHGPRLNASDVASGDYSTISGGKSNGASGSYSSVGGGYYNHATADRALIFGGDQNTASGVYSVVGGGSVNTASGTYTFVGGGSTNIASGNDSAIVGGVGSTAAGAYSMILGGWSGATRLFGEVAHANGPFAAQGDAQYSKYLMRNATTNATPTEVFLETSSSARLTLPDNFTFAGMLRIVARQSGGTASAHFARNVIIKRDSGAASTTLLDSSVVGTDYNPSAWAITVSADTTNGSLKIQVTGAAATNIRWVATFDANQVGY
jgi:hypothetical protein